MDCQSFAQAETCRVLRCFLERWNSWDLATRPGHLLADLLPLLDPLAQPRAWVASLLFGGCTFVLYLCLRPDLPELPRNGPRNGARLCVMRLSSGAPPSTGKT